MMGAKSQADESSGPAEPSHPHQKAEDMTAPETFAVPPKRPLTTGRRPDMASSQNQVAISRMVLSSPCWANAVSLSKVMDLRKRAWIPEPSATGLREADLNVLAKLGEQGLE